MNFFTSDLHIGHDKEFIWKSRGFQCIQDHDKSILKRWNSVVNPNDSVYILGDLCLGRDEKEWNNIFYALNGKKYYIIGNHDTDRKCDIYEDNYNMTLLGYSNMYYYSKHKTFFLSHYPTMVGNFADKRFFWNLSGHTHSKDKFQYGKYCIYNVAMDAHNCTPVSIDEIVKDIVKYKENESKND